ncbi:MAG TPA: GMC oxidoreductase, partial [Steroidobacteraceae bacterium]|nr:GMC oxidoreductase [Steroidobacteraceae bacterium]
NGDRPEGVGCYQVTIRRGRRWSAADAYLRPALRRRNVTLLTRAWAGRILLNGRRATGVEYWQDGVVQSATALREVIVSGGAVNSPQLLQLSGIGPGERLRGLGLPVVFDNPAVGGNLQDHLAVSYSFKATEPTLNDELHSPVGKLRNGLRYLLLRRGPLALSVNQFGGFLRADPAGDRPDVQLYFNPITYGAGDAARKRIEVDPFSGFILCFQPTRPTSRGRIDLASPDFRAPPLIAPNYLSTEKDERDVVHGGLLLQRIARTKAMRGLIHAAVPPDLDALDEAGLLADFRARAATVYHPVSTCRMGPHAGEAVVDAELRVHGIERLRVVDASVFPTVTSANTNAPTLMVARKAADMITKERA